MTQSLLVARNKEIELRLLPALANRQGLIAGATGTAKTVSLQRLAEGFSSIGSRIGREVLRGVLGSILGGGAKRR